MRIHQRYLVNGKKVTHIGRTSLDILGQNREMQNLPISRALKETATTKLARIMLDRKSTRLNSSHNRESRMPSSA